MHSKCENIPSTFPLNIQVKRGKCLHIRAAYSVTRCIKMHSLTEDDGEWLFFISSAFSCLCAQCGILLLDFCVTYHISCVLSLCFVAVEGCLCSYLKAVNRIIW